MTSDVIAFPTLLERDDTEFRRSRTSTYIRAIEEAEALWCTFVQQGRAIPRDRLAALSRQVELLEAHRPEDAGAMVTLGGLVELRLVPGLLEAMAAA